MPVSPGFQAFVLDLLAPLHPGARRLFGGAGITADGVMFALLSRDEMYFRVDATTRGRFEAAGCTPFGYNRAGKEVLIESYYAVPDGLYDQPDELLSWAKEAIAAARRAVKPRKSKKR